jgi:hypothetical protein
VPFFPSFFFATSTGTGTAFAGLVAFTGLAFGGALFLGAGFAFAGFATFFAGFGLRAADAFFFANAVSSARSSLTERRAAPYPTLVPGVNPNPAISRVFSVSKDDDPTFRGVAGFARGRNWYEKPWP